MIKSLSEAALHKVNEDALTSETHKIEQFHEGTWGIALPLHLLHAALTDSVLGVQERCLLEWKLLEIVVNIFRDGG